MITSCPKCGKACEESSMEQADAPDRLCLTCFLNDPKRAEAGPLFVPAPWDETLQAHERGLGGEPERTG